MSDIATSADRMPTGLSVETGGDSFPVAPPAPELSWRLPDRADRQRAFTLEARVGAELLSHEEESGDHRFVPWPWRPLRSTELVEWRVRLRDDTGWTAWSDWSRFEAGLFDEGWTAEWISSPEGDDLPVGRRPAFSFSTEFEIGSSVGSARLYSTALGVYEIVVNGRRAGGVELAPGTQSYHRTVYAQAADVTALLRPGRNTIEAVLSDGWYRGRAGAFRKQAAWGPRTAIRAELHVVDPDGRRVAAATDRGWQVRESRVRQADLMDGQATDLAHEPRVLGAPVPGPADAPPVDWSPAPPVRVVQEIRPVGITRLSGEVVVVDFGQNASGRVRLSSLGPRGARTLLDFGEHVDGTGDLTLDHLDTRSPDGSTVEFRQHDEVVSDGDPSSVFEPRHTVHGFRYVRVRREGLVLDPADITMQVLHSALPAVGSFACSDPDLVRLHDVAEWSFRGNAVDIPTDCPTRERAGWTGDWQVFLPTAVRMYDVDGFSRKWLRSVRDDQLDDGRICNISPDNARLQVVPDPMTDMATGSAGWGDAVVLVPWELYRHYGDRRVLEQNWEAMTRWVGFALRTAAEKRHSSRVERSAEPLPHEKYLWDGSFHFGEWLEPAPVAEDGSATPVMPDPTAWFLADKGEVGTAYLHRSVVTLARIAEVLGRADEAVGYADTAARILAAWRTEFLDDKGRTAAGTQASYVRALAFGLVPDERRAAAAGHLVELIEAAGHHLGTGFLSTADLLPVLADTGHAQVAHRLLLQRTTPSWLGMIDRGATTIWEEWEGVDRNGVASASLNHYSKVAVVRYLHTHTLGLRQAQDSVAWESFVVAPVVPEHLTWARGHLDGPQGRIEVEWRRDDSAAVLRVTVPAGSRAVLDWGGGRLAAGPGPHEIRVPSTRTLPIPLSGGRR